jgi:site-specific recombinase XerD
MLMPAVDAYLAVRRAVGFDLVPIERYLRHFAQFAAARADTHVVAQTAIDWAATAASETERRCRLMAVIRFARFVQAEDPRHEIPSEGVFCRRRQRPTPYILSEEELQRLVAHTQQLGPAGSLRPHTYSTLFGLLAATGMRVSEARALRLDDITADGLRVRESKFKKSRLLPLHETAWAALERYLDRRRRVAGNCPYLFVTRRPDQLSRTVVTQTFHQVLQAAGIPSKPGTPRPRLTDLRHTFATRALETCPDDRDHVGQHMLALTTYMGHTCVASTYWYLENVPELMSDIARRCETFVYGGAP